MKNFTKTMRIILAVSILPPDIGGPAQYALRIKQGLTEAGHQSAVVSYQGLKNYPLVLKLPVYFFRVCKAVKKADLIYTFNLTSTGLPVCLASFVLRKRFVVRLGGDFLWERAVEQGRTSLPLSQYYEQPKSFREKFFIFLQKQVLKRASKIIFSTHFQQELYQKIFAFDKGKAEVIENPFPQATSPSPKPSPASWQILFAGRFSKIKNLNLLIDAFSRVLAKTSKPLTLKLVGSGPERQNLKLAKKVSIQEPLPHQKLLEEINKSYLCIVPSLSEVSPNFALESIALGKPILLTQETGFYQRFKNDLIFINPQSVNDLIEKILLLLDEKNYQLYQQRIKAISLDWVWPQVIKAHLSLFNHLCA